MNEQEEYIDTPELAKLAEVSRATLQQDIVLGILPAKKRGLHWFIHILDAQEYVNRRRKISQSISAREFAKRANLRDHKPILEALRKGELVAFKQTNARTSTWYILEEDARAYSQRMGWEYIIRKTQSRTRPENQLNGHSQAIDLSDRCNACGSSRNIVGHLHKNSRNIRGYLCTSCQRIIDSAQEDVDRIDKVSAYLKRTRLDRASSNML